MLFILVVDEQSVLDVKAWHKSAARGVRGMVVWGGEQFGPVIEGRVSAGAWKEAQVVDLDGHP